MNLTPRDRRALAWLAVSLLLGLVVHFWPAPATARRRWWLLLATR